MKKILVTGATGFLGSHILNALKNLPEVEVIAACRRPEKLVQSFAGEIRPGDLLDPAYRQAMLKGIDVVCHTGGWGAFWGHQDLERRYFFEPTLDLIDQAIGQGGKRFIQTSTVVIGPSAQDTQAPPLDDFSLARHYTGFWPHVDFLMDLDRSMRQAASRGTQMVTMRLGHFVGAGNTRGLLPILLPRLKTHLVPWLAGGHVRLPLVAGEDMGRAFALAALASDMAEYDSFNICGSEFPTLREFLLFVTQETGLPLPHYSVSYPAAYAFGWLMEKLNFLFSGDPFLMRSIVFVSENWVASTDYAHRTLGFTPQKDWRAAVREQLVELKRQNYAWPRLAMPERAGF